MHQNLWDFASNSNIIVLVRVKVNTQVEVYEEPSILKEVVGGVIGGLLIVSLITAALYKVQYTSLFIIL